MSPNPVDYLPLVISSVAIIISVFTFIKKDKSDQFRIALEINSNLEQIVNEKNKTSDIREKKTKALEYLNMWEFFSFLVNNKEIRNGNIIKFFKPSLLVETEKIFQDYPEVASDDKAFEEIKELRRNLSSD